MVPFESSAPRIFHPGPLAPGTRLELPATAVPHLRALRRRAGSALVLFDGRGGEYSARLAHLERRAAVVSVEAFSPREAESPLAVTLVQGLAKGERMDFVVQKATELGVARILPVFTAHGAFRLPPERAASRRAHWERVAASACEQCGRNRLPVVETPAPLMDVWEQLPPGPGVVLQPGAGKALRGAGLSPGPLTLLVGPEGGLAEVELAEAARRGYLPVGLGPRVLRTETAAVAVLAALQVLAGDMG